MQTTTTVTQKGQITIPKFLRQKFGIKTFSKIYLKEENKAIKIIPSYDILDLAGKYKPKGQKRSAILAREDMEKNFTKF